MAIREEVRAPKFSPEIARLAFAFFLQNNCSAQEWHEHEYSPRPMPGHPFHLDTHTALYGWEPAEVFLLGNIGHTDPSLTSFAVEVGDRLRMCMQNDSVRYLRVIYIQDCADHPDLHNNVFFEIGMYRAVFMVGACNDVGGIELAATKTLCQVFSFLAKMFGLEVEHLEITHDWAQLAMGNLQKHLSPARV